MSGIGVGSLFEQQKVFDVVVWGTPETRDSLDSVRDLLIDTPAGGHVRLGDVADVAIAATPTAIRHQDLSRSLDVTADVQGRDVEAVAADVRSAIAGITFPLEYHAELVNDYADQHAQGRRAIAIAIAAAVGIFLLLQAAFGSWRLATASFLVLPLATAGCAIAVFLGDRVLSLGSLMGFLAVLAISMRMGVTLIRHLQRLARADGASVDDALVRRGSREQMVPIVTTAVVGVLALLPFALSGGIAGQEIVHPMAVAIVGGLVTSALLNLFVVPSLYLRFGSVAVSEPPSPDEVITVPEIDHVES
jgi:Cu/Ag efflux pump CusA